MNDISFHTKKFYFQQNYIILKLYCLELTYNKIHSWKLKNYITFLRNRKVCKQKKINNTLIPVVLR